MTETPGSGTIIDMSIQRRLAALAVSTRLQFGIVVFSALAGGGLTIFQAWILAGIIDQVHLGNSVLDDVSQSLILLVFVVLIRAALVYVNEYGALLVSERIKASLRENLTAKVLRLGPGFIQQNRAGELSYTLTQAVDALDAFYSQYMPQIIIALVLPIGILSVVFPLDLLSAIILLLTAPLIPVFMVLIGRTTEALTRRQFSAFSRMSAFFLDTIRGLAELKNLGQSQNHAARLDQVSERYRDATLKVLRISFLSALVLELAATLSVAVIAVQIGIRLLYGQIEFHQAFFLLIIAPEFYLPLRQLGARFHSAQNAVSAARRIFEILDQPDLENPTIEISREILPEDLFTSPFDIRFENVSFAYHGRETDAVSSVSFILKSGETTAVVGLNGSGKSTLAALLLRFIQPDTGRILYNGFDIQYIPVQKWRAGIAWLDQQPILFNDSLRNNLHLSNPDATEEQMVQAVKNSQLAEVISSLPNGYDTLIGENAFRLSGGQAQRLGLSRAFLKNAPLMILDEPTSHLDAILENELEESLAKLHANRTCLIIAHRKATAISADQVVYMQNGFVAGFGKHDDLMISSISYAQLFGDRS